MKGEGREVSYGVRRRRREAREISRVPFHTHTYPIPLCLRPGIVHLYPLQGHHFVCAPHTSPKHIAVGAAADLLQYFILRRHVRGPHHHSREAGERGQRNRSRRSDGCRDSRSTCARREGRRRHRLVVGLVVMVVVLRLLLGPRWWWCGESWWRRRRWWHFFQGRLVASSARNNRSLNRRRRRRSTRGRRRRGRLRLELVVR